LELGTTVIRKYELGNYVTYLNLVGFLIQFVEDTGLIVAWYIYR